MNYSLEKHHLAANTIRGLAMDAVQKAESGHPGMPMGMADAAVILWTQFLKFNPTDPQWPDRDRFVLSAGHGSMLLYSLLHLSGYDLPLQEIKDFRQWESITPGHPENHLTPGIETTTGPLGQGISNAVGMALAERWLSSRLNRPDYEVVDHHTYVIASDGDLMEGISHESCALAAHLKLNKLIVLYDNNKITIDGSTDLAFTEQVMVRFKAYGWYVQEVDGHDPEEILAALKAAHTEEERPSIIACRTHIAYGSPNKQDTASAHGSPLGDDEIRLTKEKLGLPTDKKFNIPDGVYDFMQANGKVGAAAQEAWRSLLDRYEEAHPELAQQFHQMLNDEPSPGWRDHIPTFSPDEKMATRASSGKVLNAIAPHYPSLLGGSADLTGSNKTNLEGEEDLTGEDFSGRYIRFGVREHGMGAMLSGMALHEGVRPYGGTFLVFSDYMRPTIRLAALMELPVIYVFTHDSIGLGEDGPTHQPIEHLMSLRVIPNLITFRPADANETAVAWQVAVEHTDGPTALILTRQGVPTFDRNRYAPASGAERGAYVISPADDPQVILIGTGSEVQIALKAQEMLAEKEVAASVVSMPSWELFDAQPEAYREEVLPTAVAARVAVEAGQKMGWERYVGQNGKVIGLDHFGASAPYQEIFEGFGITPEAMTEAALSLL